MRKKVIQAIKGFDTKSLRELLVDDMSYMNVSKETFIKAMENTFQSSKEKGNYGFDDVFFGLCQSCNIGCEVLTFYINDGHFLDLFIKSDSDGNIEDIYICNNLTNFPDLKKPFDLGFHFCKDEEVKFRPNVKYLKIKALFEDLSATLLRLETGISLDVLVTRLNEFDFLIELINEIRLFERWEYKLYIKASDLVIDIERIIYLKNQAGHAINAMIDFQKIESQRDKLIWFFNNESNMFNGYSFILNEKSSIVTYKAKTTELIIDISGY